MKWLLCLGILCPSVVKAQEITYTIIEDTREKKVVPDRVYTPEEGVLARMCLSEGGWVLGADCDAIYIVLRRRADSLGVSLTEMSHAYGKSTFNRNRRDRRSWVVFVTRSMVVPRRWPRNLRWSTHKALWYQILERAHELLSGTRIPAPCSANHWGAPGGNARAAHARGWIRVSCGATRNVFWRAQRRQNNGRTNPQLQQLQ